MREPMSVQATTGFEVEHCEWIGCRMMSGGAHA